MQSINLSFYKINDMTKNSKSKTNTKKEINLDGKHPQNKLLYNVIQR